MLENLIFSVNSVLPFFLLILLGALLAKTNTIPKSFFQMASGFTFKIGLPFQLFYSIAGIDGGNLLSGSFMLYTAIVTTASFLLIWLVTELFFHKDKAIIGTLVQCTFRGNYVLIGIPLAGLVLGQGAMHAASVVSIVVITLHNALSVIVLLVRGHAEPESIKKIIRGILLNPLIIGIFLAMPLMFLQIRLPEAAMRTIMYVGATGTPLGLLSIGGVMSLADATARLRPAVYGGVMKLLLLPAVVIPISCFFGYRGEELLILLMMAATPAAASSYVMAVQMKGDGPLAANILILTTLFSAFTLAVSIYILRSLGYI